MPAFASSPARVASAGVGPAPEVAAVRRAVRVGLRDLDNGDLVLAACSGGADSMALAAALAFVAPRLGLRAGGLTVDHALQEGSGERAQVVAAQLRDLGLAPVEVLTVEVAEGRGGPEAAARRARYAALDAAAARLGAAAVLLGHTRDDQAETVLLGLARGSGARSLAGMPERRERYRRPLLDLPRVTVRAAAEGLPTWTDPHNTDGRFARSRVRHAVLPVLEEQLGGDAAGDRVAAALARTAALLRRDADALDAWAAREHEAAVRGPGQLDAAALAALPPAVRTRVLRRAALAAGCPGTDLTADHVAEIERLLTDWRGQGPLHLPGGVRAARACGTLSLTAEARVEE